MVIALLPAATATVAVLRGRERPPLAFWLITGVGALAAIAFASVQSGGFGQLHWADLLLLGAVVAAAIGYAEGGLLARELGAWQTVSWALVLASPLMVVLTVVSVAQQPPSATPVQWAAFAYLGVVSMFLGFFAWYRGLAIGPMAQVSQVQLVQPVLSICWAGLLLGEALTWTTIIGGLAVILCAGAAVRGPAQSQAPAAHPALPSSTTLPTTIPPACKGLTPCTPQPISPPAPTPSSDLLTRPAAANLVTMTPQGLLATLLPFVYDPSIGEHGALLGPRRPEQPPVVRARRSENHSSSSRARTPTSRRPGTRRRPSTGALCPPGTTPRPTCTATWWSTTIRPGSPARSGG